MLNKVIIECNLAKEPEFRAFQNGSGVTTMRCASSRKFTANGQQQEETVFFTVNVFGKSAENCNKYLEKGSHIIVEGRLYGNSWERDGQKRYNIEVTADTVHFLSKSNAEGRGDARQGNCTQSRNDAPRMPQNDYSNYAPGYPMPDDTVIPGMEDNPF